MKFRLLTPPKQEKSEPSKDIERMISHKFKRSEKIDECPFCGETEEDGLELLETPDHETWFIQCDDCMTQGPPHFEREGAIALWNSRIEDIIPHEEPKKNKRKENEQCGKESS